MKINIAGDLYINEKLLNENLLSKEIEAIFTKKCVNIVNLECPIINEDCQPITKTGPNIFSNKKIINHLKQINTNIVTLANNHILDFGETGIINTCKELSLNHIKYIGVVKNSKYSLEPIILEEESFKVGIINFCENEWSIATEDRAGAYPLDLINNYRLINELKDKTDYIIVIHHGGHEFYPYPSPRIKKLFRFFVDIGVDVVVNHHSHCIGGYELYKNKHIFYSLGNFCFTLSNRNLSWYEGLILSLNINQESIGFELTPVKQDIETYHLNICSMSDRNRILKRIEKANTIISDDIKLNSEFTKYINNNINRLRMFSPLNFLKPKIIKRILFKFKIDKFLISRDFNLPFLNYVRCESHRDVLINLLKRETEGKKQ